MKFGDPWQLVGNTPAVKIRDREFPQGCEVYVKLEGHNPTGSIKDRAATYMLREAIKGKRLTKNHIILDATSGNMGNSLAYFGRLLGRDVHVVSSSKLTTDKRAFMERFGARVIEHGKFTIDGNRYCRELALRSGENYCFLDQLHNWENPKAHFETTGPEILRDFPDVAMVVGSLGSGGTLYGAASFLKSKVPEIHVVAVEAASGTQIPGAGAFSDGDYVTPFIRRGVAEGLFDFRSSVSAREATEGVEKLRDSGIFAGMQTGAIRHAAVAAAHEWQPKGSIVMISGDTGWKSLNQVKVASAA